MTPLLDCSDAYAHVANTLLGPLALVWTHIGLRHVYFSDSLKHNNCNSLQASIELQCFLESKKYQIVNSPIGQVHEWVNALTDYLQGKNADLTRIPIDWSNISEFAKQVYLNLRLIPRGTTITYQNLANCMKTKAFQAVGSALGRNPIPIVIPCHRVVGQDNAGGFSAPGGLSTKSLLLAIEGGSLDDVHHRFAQRHLVTHDPRLATIVRSLPCSLPVVPLTDASLLLRSLIRSIIGQQLSIQASATIFARFENIILNNSEMLDKQIASKIIETSMHEFQKIGISRNKYYTLCQLSKFILSDTLQLSQLPYMSDTAIVEKLIQIKGIGRWTVEMLLIFTLARPDVIPISDLGLRKALQKIDSLQEVPTVEWVYERTQIWSPWRSIGTWYAWKAVIS